MNFQSTTFVIIALGLMASVCCQDLYYNYYDNSCDWFEEIVAKKVRQAFYKDKTIAASLIRLHFHDCAVRGCDASILLDYPNSERNARSSKTLRGFELLDDIKNAIERRCPQTVSCADILTAAARDATLLVEGPFWANKYGRKDGLISNAYEADALPGGRENVSTLIEFYQSLGLNDFDLVVLSGAHTIGKTSCDAIKGRLYNNYETENTKLASDYSDYLRRKCKNETEKVDLDPTTPYKFDNEYFINLEKNMGVLYSDQVLNTDHRTARYVDYFADNNEHFAHVFASSMVKLGGVLGDAQDDGEIRVKCSRINKRY